MDFFGFLGGLQEGLTSVLAGLFQSFVAFVVAAFDQVFIFLSNLVTALTSIFRAVYRAIRHVLSDIIHGRFIHLWNDYLKLKHQLQDWYDKHFKWLLELRKRYQQWFKNTVEPILNAIQRFRRVLAVFRIFHVKWAQKLDDKLAGIEGKIIKNTLAIQSKLNQVISFIDLVFTADGLISRQWQVASIWQAITDLRGIFGLPLVRGLTAAEKQSSDRDATRYSTAVVDAHVRELVAHGWTPEDLLLQQQLRDDASAVSSGQLRT